ncbi:DUF11 domain-containing protein [Leucothrix pacifica]|uniref:DUF11 domain-containing protein n=1 Tax=Leucothrix pacifica TaxID=1247513 RepID=A0A317CN48_9GAMM|nr:DUF11 domain-containing protein [Leucothrix pacifica]PWQ99956.1 hypothetical protein DKW60_03890 [Leucothrix pacifica]
MNQNKKSHQFINYLMVFLLLVSGAVNAKAPVAGTIIKNQATATYKDSAGIEQTATSNLVETVIQQVGAFILESDQSRYGIAGQLVSFPHVLTNTGNGDDTFTLNASNLTGDNYDLTNITIYPDVNQDGVADSLTPITDTGVLASEEAFYFVVVATVPDSATDAQTADLLVEGVSDFSGASQTNADEVIVSDKAVIQVTKSISSNSGEAGSGPYTVTLTYSNQSTSDASNVILIDALPEGMNYVANSGEWSLTGSGVALTDNNKTDAQGIGADTVIYCAYHADCTGLAEASMDADNLSTNQVTAIIATVVSGDSGTISFDVTLDSTLEASTLLNTAEFQYFNSAVVITDQKTNQVPLEVIAEPGVVANGSTTNDAEGIDEPVSQTTATLGSTVAFDNVIWNRGNSVDTFDISVDTAGSTFPTGTTFTLYHSDGYTPLLDTDNSSVVDTGPLDPGESYTVVLKAKLPMTGSAVGDNGGAGFDVTKTAISANDPSVSNPVTDHLDEITGSEVDLTNVAAIGGAGVLGVGPGPETNAQSQLILAPGESGVFKLYVNNTSTVADSFDLTFSKDNPFVAGTAPAGWRVAFHIDAGATNCSTLGPVVNNTALIAPGDSKLICAKITLPKNADFSGNAVSIYFRVQSPLTQASDIKHDAVYMTAAQNLILEPDNRAQVEPGSSVVYTHDIHNSGNTVFTGINMTSTDTLAGDGWTSVLYEDTDGNGVLSAGDLPVGSFDLGIGERKTIFAKVFAPANAPLGAHNLTDITAIGTTDAGTPVNITVKAQDMTFVAMSNMNITKQQAPDVNCDGDVDGGSVFSFDAFQAQPGTCVLYNLTATNTSSSIAKNVRIDDAIPEFTSHFTDGGALPTITQGSIVQSPAEGDTGLVEGSAGDVNPGGSVSLVFGVMVE